MVIQAPATEECLQSLGKVDMVEQKYIWWHRQIGSRLWYTTFDTLSYLTSIRTFISTWLADLHQEGDDHGGDRELCYHVANTAKAQSNWVATRPTSWESLASWMQWCSRFITFFYDLSMVTQAVPFLEEQRGNRIGMVESCFFGSWIMEQRSPNCYASSWCTCLLVLGLLAAVLVYGVWSATPPEDEVKVDKSSRNPHVDNAKFLGMVLVCWSHLGGLALKGRTKDLTLEQGDVSLCWTQSEKRDFFFRLFPLCAQRLLGGLYTLAPAGCKLFTLPSCMPMTAIRIWFHMPVFIFLSGSFVRPFSVQLLMKTFVTLVMPLMFSERKFCQCFFVRVQQEPLGCFGGGCSMWFARLFSVCLTTLDQRMEKIIKWGLYPVSTLAEVLHCHLVAFDRNPDWRGWPGGKDHPQSLAV